MATYVIGDIQGCYDEFRRLLKTIAFNASRDTLWLCGDLVNRGPKSLEVMQFISDLKNVQVVLGNHDIHLLAVNENPELLKKSDTFTDVLDAADRNVLCHWLRQQPLLHYDTALNYVLVHAGLPPQWDLKLAQQCAHEVESVLRGADYKTFLQQIYGDEPRCWSAELSGIARLRFNLNCLTRLRFCDEAGRLHLEYKGPLGSQPPTLVPWFRVSWRHNKDLRILFGHWSALEGKIQEPNIYALDTGCIWGGSLTAMCLEDGKIYQESCHMYHSPVGYSD